MRFDPKRFAITLLRSLMCGFVLSLAFPPYDWYMLSFIALAPFFFLLYEARSYFESAAAALAFSAGFFLPLLFWVTVFGYLPLFGFFILLAPGTIAFSLTAKFLFRKAGRAPVSLLVLPGAWVFTELAHNFGMFAFDWTSLGYSMTKSPFLPLAALVGVEGLSWLIVFINTALFLVYLEVPGVLKKQNKRLFAYTALLLFVPAVVLFLKPGSIGGKPGTLFSAALIQGNIPQDEKFETSFRARNMKVYLDMSEKAAGKGAELIVWPETAWPDTISSEEELDVIKKAASKTGAHYLFGAFSGEGRRFFNSVFLVKPSGKTERYDKVHLVPFGEYVPLKALFGLHPLLRDVLDLTPADRPVLLDFKGHKLGSGICFESSDKRLVRQMVNSGASFLVFITNDSFFPSSGELRMHLNAGIFRAVENGRYVLEAANTGLTAFISPQGDVLNELLPDKAASLQGSFSVSSRRTLYTRGGWMFPWALALAALAALALRARR